MFLQYTGLADPWDWQKSAANYPHIPIISVCFYTGLADPWDWQKSAANYPHIPIISVCFYTGLADPWDWQNSPANYPVFNTFQSRTPQTRSFTIKIILNVTSFFLEKLIIFVQHINYLQYILITLF
jgi:hypothetical protein